MQKPKVDKVDLDEKHTKNIKAGYIDASNSKAKKAIESKLARINTKIYYLEKTLKEYKENSAEYRTIKKEIEYERNLQKKIKGTL